MKKIILTLTLACSLNIFCMELPIEERMPPQLIEVIQRAPETLADAYLGSPRTIFRDRPQEKTVYEVENIKQTGIGTNSISVFFNTNNELVSIVLKYMGERSRRLASLTTEELNSFLAGRELLRILEGLPIR